MPISATTIKSIRDYCAKDLEPVQAYEWMFDFVADPTLKALIIEEFKSARYIYKLMEALKADGKELIAHVKFQITQYAAIYEAIIVHLLWTKFASTLEVKEIEYHKTFKKVADWPKLMEVTVDQEEVHLCVEREVKTSRSSIKFDDKIDAAVKIGFVDHDLGEEIKTIYKLRNSIHLESAIKNEVQFEIAQSKLAYWRMRPFTDKIRQFLQAHPEFSNASPLPTPGHLLSGTNTKASEL